MDEKQEKLVLDNRGLVKYLVNTIGISQYEFEDFVSVGTIGLIKAALTYEETKGANFSTYATRCIINEINMQRRIEKKHYNVLHLDASLNADEDGNELLLADVLSDPKEHFTYEIEKENTFISIINHILNDLTLIEKVVMLYSISGMEQRSIAKKLNISQSFVSKLQKRAKEKIKRHLEKPNRLTKKIYCMSIVNGLFSITFPLIDDSILCELNITNIRVETKGKEKVVIQTPANLRYFFSVAEIICKIEA